MSLFVFVAFPYSAKAAFVVVFFHIIDSDLYSIYNTAGEAASEFISLLKSVLSDCISPERYPFVEEIY